MVDDWHAHGLYAPPRSHHWVQTCSDFVRLAIATGINRQLLLHD